MIVHLVETENQSATNIDGFAEYKKEAKATIPIEDIGIVVLDNKQVTITQGLIEALLDNNVAVITCNSKHLPTGLLLPLSGNTIQSERFRAQIDASEPLKKQLWAQTASQKIKNQAALLESIGINNSYLIPLYKNVNSGDTNNCEATAAAYYWQHIFSGIDLNNFEKADDNIANNEEPENIDEEIADAGTQRPRRDFLVGLGQGLGKGLVEPAIEPVHAPVVALPGVEDDDVGAQLCGIRRGTAWRWRVHRLLGNELSGNPHQDQGAG